MIACAPGDHPEVAQALRACGACHLPIELDRAGTNAFADLWSLLRPWRLLRQFGPYLVLAGTAKAVIYGAGIWVRMQASHDAWRAEREVDTSGIPTIKAA